MKEFSKKLRDMLTDFIVSEIGSKGLDGVTYAAKQRTPQNEEDIARFIAIREEADACGYDTQEVFRVFEVANGYVFDMDLKAMSQILVKIAKSAASITGKHMDMADSVYHDPEAMRKSDAVRLAKFINEKVENGETEVQVALFSRVNTTKISYTGDVESKGSCLVSVPAFRIRANDIKALNVGPLRKYGIVVREVSPQYITPRENGVITRLVFEKR